VELKAALLLLIGAITIWMLFMWPVRAESPYRLSLFCGSNRNSPFACAFTAAFEKLDVEKAAPMLVGANAAQWKDLGNWVCTPPLVARKVEFVHVAITAMRSDQEAAAEALLEIMEELREDRVDHEHVPAASNT
jgi:hypothetical protein